MFRGTQEGADWWTNLKFLHRHFPALGRVHEVRLRSIMVATAVGKSSCMYVQRGAVPAEKIKICTACQVRSVDSGHQHCVYLTRYVYQPTAAVFIDV